MGQRKLRYRRIGPVLKPADVSKTFIAIFKEEIMQAINEGRFPGIKLEYGPPVKQKKG